MKYKIVQKIGIGGMAEVYRANVVGAEGFQKTVAIKRLLPHLTHDQTLIKMFVEEAQILSTLQHPNIVQVFDFEKVDDDFLLIMEYVKGKTLAQITAVAEQQELAMDAGMVFYVLAKAASALAYVYGIKDDQNRAMKVVHRDINPQNIMISMDGQVKVTDFGIAKMATSEDSTRAGFLRGKISYFSPEQVLGAKAEHRSDLFSLGAVGYRLLTGKALFPRESEAETFQAIRQWPGLDRSKVYGHVPRQLWQVLCRMLEPDPEQRYQSAVDLSAELKTYSMELSDRTGPEDMAGFMSRLFSSEEFSAETFRGDERSLGEMIDSELHRVESLLVTAHTPPVPRQGSLEPTRELSQERQPEPKLTPRPWRLAAGVIVLVLGLVLILVLAWIGSGEETPGQPEPPEFALPPKPMPSVPPAALPVTPEPAQVEPKPAPVEVVVKAPTPKKVRKRKRSGLLTLNSEPWAFVEINGKRHAKTTPIVELKLKEGTYKIRLSNPALKRHKTITVRIRPGKTTQQVVRF